MASTSPRTLGTALRHLLELLDGDVAAIYRESRLKYRPRYTPLMRVLARTKRVSIRDLASAAGVSHSAASQTIAKMRTDGLVDVEAGTDGRERVVSLSRRGQALLPKLESHWEATNAAAAELDAELSARLTQCVEEAIAALESRSFKARIHAKQQLIARRARS